MDFIEKLFLKHKDILTFKVGTKAGPSQWIAIDWFNVPEHLNMLEVLNLQLFILQMIIG